MDPTITVALIGLATVIFNEMARAQRDKRNNAELVRAQLGKGNNAVVIANPAERENADSLERMTDSIDMEVMSFQNRINIIKAEELVLERMADEAITIFGNNVQVIMLFHGLGSIFLQLNHPYAGLHISVLMVVSFFFSFIVAFVVTSNKTEGLSGLDKDLQKRQRDLQKEVTYFEVTVDMTLAHNGAHGVVLNRMNFIKGKVSTLQTSITGILDSSLWKTNRIKANFQVTVGAIIYGFSFPVMAYYLLYFVDLRKKGFVNSMWK